MEKAQHQFLEHRNRNRQIWRKARRLLRLSRFLKRWGQLKRPAAFSNLVITELIDESKGGMVYKAVDRINGAIYALKEFNCLFNRKNVCNEIQILKRLNHPNLLKIHELFEISYGKIYLLLDYYMDKEGSTMSMDETYLAYVAHQVLLGLDYLHHNNIWHGDFNTSSIHFNSSNHQVKVSYFGKSLSRGAPVIDEDDIGIRDVYEKYSWDILCVGLTILKLYTVSSADLGHKNTHADFEQLDSYQLPKFNLKSTDISFLPRVQKPSKDFWNFLLCCMQKSASRRWTIAQLIRHSFIAQRSESFIKQKEPFSAASSISSSWIPDTTNLSSGGAEQHISDKRPKFYAVDEKRKYHTEKTTNPMEDVAIWYPNLTSLDRCIRHCNLFPLDFEFERDKLVQQWIAEECFDAELERMEDVAKTYFDILVEREDILPSKLDNRYGEMKYKVNASKALTWPLTECEYLRFDNDNLDEIPGRTRHLSLHHRKFDRTTFDVLQKFKQLHTLLLLGCHGDSIERLPNNIFLHLNVLKILDLSSNRLTELPSSIGNLESLRVLDLSENPIKLLPESTDRLNNLQTLRLRDCFSVHALPKEMRKLINLCHLDLDIVQQLKAMPKGMGSLVNLRTLRAFLVGKKDGCGITELKNMNKIVGSFCISRLENVRNTDEAKEAAIGNKKYIEKLEFRWTDQGNENSETEVEVLEHLQPHFGLKELQILFYSGVKLPSWINHPSFTELANITLYKCINCHILPSIGELPSLKFLSIVGMNSVIDINSLFCRNHGTQGCNVFPRLEKLIVDDMINLEKWTGLEDGDLPSLHHISIRYCPKLHILPILLHLRALQYLEISHCMELVSLPEGGLPSSLESLIIRECPKINERCCKDDGEDRLKIAHVKSIWIDFKEISLD